MHPAKANIVMLFNSTLFHYAFKLQQIFQSFLVSVKGWQKEGKRFAIHCYEEEMRSFKDCCRFSF